MNKKHFIAAARKIANLRQVAANQSDAMVQRDHYNRAQAAEDIFAAVAREFNPNFDDAWFAAACRATE